MHLLPSAMPSDLSSVSPSDTVTFGFERMQSSIQPQQRASTPRVPRLWRSYADLIKSRHQSNDVSVSAHVTNSVKRKNNRWLICDRSFWWLKRFCQILCSVAFVHQFYSYLLFSSNFDIHTGNLLWICLIDSYHNNRDCLKSIFLANMRQSGSCLAS